MKTVQRVTGHDLGLAAPVLRRARSVAEMSTFRGGIGSAASRAAALAFRPRPSDILIATFPKCGTTWLQQIVHGLRTRGSMDFDEITLVVPWLELARDLGIDPDGPQAAEPRAFKSHLSWHEIPQGGALHFHGPGSQGRAGVHVSLPRGMAFRGRRHHSGRLRPEFLPWRRSGTGATGSTWRRGGRNAGTRTC